MNLGVRRILISTTCLALGLSACTKRETGGKPGSPAAAASSVDVSADRATARDSWLLAVARDSSGLTGLAQSNPGWGKLFTSDPAGALGDFLPALKGAPPISPVRTGAARAALELAEAHLAMGAIAAGVAKSLGAAKTDAGGKDALGWRCYLDARSATREGKDAAAVAAKCASGTAADPWLAALKPGGPAPIAALLAGKAEGATVTAPAGGTPEYGERLAIRALVAARNGAEAVARFAKVSASAPDITVGTGDTAVSFRDPVLADLGAQVAALQALDALGQGNDWGTLLRARALLILGRAPEAVSALDALLKAPPAEAPMADVVLTDALSVADLKLQATALKARAQAAAGDAAGAKATAATLPSDTIGHRVLKTWAGVAAGEKLDTEAFPDDRALLGRAMAAEVDALGAQAAGVADVAALSLVDRLVDAVERRFAQAAVDAGVPELALKHLENAEDKAAAFAPSPRNLISALAHAARENARIGRPRVALKYLSRLAERFPAVAGPSDMLRDLLTIHAMEQEGGAASGQ